MSAPFFHNPVAVENSSYSWPADGQLVRYDGREPSRMAQDVHASFRALLHDPEFPCVGAKSVVNQDSYRFGLYGKLGSKDATAGLALDLDGASTAAGSAGSCTADGAVFRSADALSVLAEPAA